MNKLIVAICYYTPLVISCLNIQAIVSQFISPSISQLMAYINLMLVTLGIFLFRNNFGTLSSTNRLWFIFYVLYYSFGLLATGRTGFQTSIIATLVPVIYFTGFYFLLSNKEQFKIFFRVITVCFVISSFLTIIFLEFNINLKTGEIHPWELDRAGGITGDANAAAHTSLFAFILFNHLYKPSKDILYIFKIIILAILLYSLFLTFSTTGLFTFVIVFSLINYKYFTGLRLILFAAIIPLFYGGILTLQSQSQSLNLSDAQIDKINNITNILTFNFDKVDNSGRGDLLEKALYYLYENPILGNGVNFAVAIRAHNTYAGVWIDAGILTFLFFIFMLIYFLFKTLTIKPQLRFLAMSILIVLYIFMISLQSVINQPYLIVLFVFVGYIIDHNKLDLDYTDKFYERKD